MSPCQRHGAISIYTYIMWIYKIYRHPRDMFHPFKYNCEYASDIWEWYIHCITATKCLGNWRSVRKKSENILHQKKKIVVKREKKRSNIFEKQLGKI